MCSTEPVLASEHGVGGMQAGGAATQREEAQTATVLDHDDITACCAARRPRPPAPPRGSWTRRRGSRVSPSHVAPAAACRGTAKLRRRCGRAGAVWQAQLCGRRSCVAGAADRGALPCACHHRHHLTQPRAPAQPFPTIHHHGVPRDEGCCRAAGQAGQAGREMDWAAGWHLPRRAAAPCVGSASCCSLSPRQPSRAARLAPTYLHRNTTAMAMSQRRPIWPSGMPALTMLLAAAAASLPGASLVMPAGSWEGRVAQLRPCQGCLPLTLRDVPGTAGLTLPRMAARPAHPQCPQWGLAPRLLCGCRSAPTPAPGCGSVRPRPPAGGREARRVQGDGGMGGVMPQGGMHGAAHCHHPAPATRPPGRLPPAHLCGARVCLPPGG